MREPEPPAAPADKPAAATPAAKAAEKPRPGPRDRAAARDTRKAAPGAGPAAEPPPVLHPATVGDPALISDGRTLGQQPFEAIPAPTGDNPTLVVTRAMGRTPRSLYPAEALSPPGVPVHDTLLQSPDLSEAAPVALNSFEALKAGIPAGPFRAGLVEESDNEIDRPRIEAGTVMWRIEQAPGSAPDSPPTALVAEIVIEKSRMKSVVTFRPASDPATMPPLGIEIALGTMPAAVTQIGVPELRNPGIERGIPLYGTMAGGAAGEPFAINLANNERDGEQNVRLLTTRPWIDVPFRTKTGKRYTLAFEKGTAVREMMRSAFRSWRLPWLP